MIDSPSPSPSKYKRLAREVEFLPRLRGTHAFTQARMMRLHEMVVAGALDHLEMSEPSTADARSILAAVTQPLSQINSDAALHVLEGMRMLTAFH